MLPLVVCVVLASVGCCNPCSPHCVCASCVNVCGSWAGVAGQLEGLYPTLPLNSRTSQLCCLPCSQMYPAGMVAALPDATQKSQIPYACQYTFLWLTRGVSPLRVVESGDLSRVPPVSIRGVSSSPPSLHHRASQPPEIVCRPSYLVLQGQYSLCQVMNDGPNLRCDALVLKH